MRPRALNDIEEGNAGEEEVGQLAGEEDGVDHGDLRRRRRRRRRRRKRRRRRRRG